MGRRKKRKPFSEETIRKMKESQKARWDKKNEIKQEVQSPVVEPEKKVFKSTFNPDIDIREQLAKFVGLK